MSESKQFICVCGKIFNNGQKFNGHKSHCKEHQLQEYGSLEKYYFRQRQNQCKMTKSIKTKRKIRKELKNLQQQKELEIWLQEQHKCKTCNKIMTEFYSSGVYCSKECAHSRILSDETKKKISKSVTKVTEKKYCLLCNKQIKLNSKTGYCRECLLHAPELQEYRSNAAKHRLSFVKNRKYWMPRNQLSYAEKFWITVLDNNKITYEHDKPVKINNKHHYFLDFYIERNGKFIDLEIDGKQHQYKDRKESDIQRDKFLKDNGYLVYRISWNEINSENGKQIMKSKITKFLDFYNNIEVAGSSPVIPTTYFSKLAIF